MASLSASRSRGRTMSFWFIRARGAGASCPAFVVLAACPGQGRHVGSRQVRGRPGSAASCLCSQGGGRQLPSRPLRSRLEKLAITCPAGAGALSPALVLPGDALQHPAWFWFWRILPGLCFIARNSALEIAHFFVHFCIINREQLFDIIVISLFASLTFSPVNFLPFYFYVELIGQFSAGIFFKVVDYLHFEAEACRLLPAHAGTQAL